MARIPLIAISGGGCFDASFQPRLAGDLGAIRTLEKPLDIHAFHDFAEEVLEGGQADEVVGQPKDQTARSRMSEVVGLPSV